MADCKLISYLRVSTKRQGESGLGLEGQRTAVESYVSQSGCKLIGTYVEVESGKRSDRPELAKAMAHARFAGAKLVIAKLDRLSRNVAFLSNLMEGGVDFVACDNPNANRLTIHILAAVAEDEAKRISERTKAGLAAFRSLKMTPKRFRSLPPDHLPADIDQRRGKLGAELEECRNLTDEARKRGAARAGVVHAKMADEFNSWITPRVRELRKSGMTLQAIADQLNAEGHTTRRNKAWTHVQVLNLLRKDPKPTVG